MSGSNPETRHVEPLEAAERWKAVMRAIREETPLREEDDPDARRARFAGLTSEVCALRAACEDCKADSTRGDPGIAAVEEAIATAERAMMALLFEEARLGAEEVREHAGDSRACRRAASDYAAALRAGCDRVREQAHGRPELDSGRVIQRFARVTAAFRPWACRDEPARRRLGTPRPRARRTAARRAAGPRSGTDPGGDSDPGEPAPGTPGCTLRFERFHALTPELAPSECLALALALPTLEASLWADLAVRCSADADRQLAWARR